MSDTTTVPHTEAKVVSVQLPASLLGAVQELAMRDHNPLSAVLRRLIVLGLSADQQQVQHG